MWLLIDNYDSFTYILADYLCRLEEKILVIKNDQFTIAEIIKLNPRRIILSPGPGHPNEIPLLHQIIEYYHKTIPILGICLGHQAIGTYFGAICSATGKPKLGKTSPLKILENHLIFKNITEENAEIMHYHSLSVTDIEKTNLISIATDDDGLNMVLTHKNFHKVIGIQFHPESVLTNIGFQLLENWKEMYE